MSKRTQAIAELLQYGLHHQSAGQLDEAEAAYRRLLGASPNHPDALHLLGMVAYARGQMQPAAELIGRAIALKPHMAMYHSNLGNILSAQGKIDAAIDSYMAAYRRKPDFPDLNTGLGLALRRANRLGEAEAALQQAVRQAPDDASVHSNLACVLTDMGRPEAAEAALGEALRLAPDSAEYTSNLGMIQLLAGRLEDGFDAYQARWHVPPMAPRGFRQRLWKGEPLGGQILLVHAEQGFGDTLQFCRYLTLFQPDDRVILEVQRPLLRLMGSLPRSVTVVAAGDPLPDFDLHCPLLTLPVAFGTRLETIPKTVPYLRADTADAARWEQRMPAQAGVRIGLTWAGSRYVPEVDQKRSLPIGLLEPLLQTEGAVFVSLQKGAPEGQQLAGSALETRMLDWTDELADFADTAALIEALDLVISVDTAVIHLAGALGKPAWLLNRFDTCRRWLLGRDDSPWYPSLRQFRQTEPGDWAGVVARVQAALPEFRPRRPA